MNFQSEIARGIWAISPDYARGYIPQLIQLVKNPNPESNRNKGGTNSYEEYAQMKAELVNADAFVIGDPALQWFPITPEDAPKNSVAILHLRQPITKYDIPCGDSGMLVKADLLMRAAQNDNIKAIVLVQDSGGGEGRAARYMAEKVKEASALKPVVAFVEDLSASASYYIGSAATQIIANSKEAIIGSIGTYMTIADYTEYFAKEGIKLHEIYADESTDKNADWRKLIADGDESGIKTLVNRFNDTFLADVAAFRGERLSAPRSDWGTGKIFFADAAKDMGLIDDIGTLEQVIESLINL